MLRNPDEPPRRRFSAGSFCLDAWGHDRAVNHRHGTSYILRFAENRDARGRFPSCRSFRAFGYSFDNVTPRRLPDERNFSGSFPLHTLSRILERSPHRRSPPDGRFRISIALQPPAPPPDWISVHIHHHETPVSSPPAPALLAIASEYLSYPLPDPVRPAGILSAFLEILHVASLKPAARPQCASDSLLD